MEQRVNNQTASPTQKMLLAIWQDVMDLPEIGLEEDFFELGGNSSEALEIFNAIAEKFEKRLPLGTLIECPTVQTLAEALDDLADPDPYHSLVTVKTGDRQRPLFLASMVATHFYCLQLIPHLGADQSVYALPVRGLDDGDVPNHRIEGLAAHCIDLMRQVDPVGPYQLMGHSAGGLVAFEIARQLGPSAVDRLVLLDTGMPGTTAMLAGKVIREPWTAARYAGALVSQSLGRHTKDETLGLDAARRGAWFRYRPKPYDGRVILITASERPNTVALHRAWRRLAKGGLVTTEVQGDHDSILQEPRVRELGREVRRLLE